MDDPPGPARSFWRLIPRRDLVRVLLLAAALLAVLALRRCTRLHSLADVFAPPPPRPAAGAIDVHVRPHPAPPSPVRP